MGIHVPDAEALIIGELDIWTLNRVSLLTGYSTMQPIVKYSTNDSHSAHVLLTANPNVNTLHGDDFS